VLRELRTHLEDKSQELVEAGFSKEEATEVAACSLGPPHVIARQIYEVYSQGSWRQALFAALPHFMIALLFTLHWWQNAIWISAILLVAIIVAIYGWQHGKPAWLFPWLGYCLIPVIAAGILLIYLPSKWTGFAALAYAPLALFFLFTLTTQAVKRDWLFASLMLLPIPVVIGWILALKVETGLPRYEQLYDAAPWIALSFAVLAVTVATFIRVRQRWIKTGALLTPEILILFIAALVSQNPTNIGGWLVLIALSLLLIISPILLERNMKYSRKLTAHR